MPNRSVPRITWFLALALLACAPWLAQAADKARATVERAMRELADPLPGKRADAAKALAGQYPEGACGVPLLEVALRDQDASVRKAAVAAIVALADRGAHDLVAFLADTKRVQNRAFDKARRLIVERGARITPWALDEVEGRDARAVRFCLTPEERDPRLRRQMRHVFRELLAAGAGTFRREGKGLLPLEQRRVACAALAVHGLGSLAQHETSTLPKGAIGLTRHADDSVRWGGVRLLEVMHANSPEANEALRQAGVSAKGAGARSKAKHDLAALIKKLPDPSKRIGGLDLLVAESAIEELARMGPAARTAVPKLERILSRATEEESVRFSGSHFGIVGALCRIQGPREPWISQLLQGLKGAELLPKGEERRAVAAANALAGCVEAITTVKTRTRIAQHAGAGLGNRATELQEALVSVLEALGRDARPAAVALTGALAHAEQQMQQTFTKVREKAKKPATDVGQHEAFLADPWGFVVATGLRHRTAQVLMQIRPLPEAARGALRRLTHPYDPLLACELAAALRK